MISFIIPYNKSRSNHLLHLSSNISNFYNDFQIIICEQDDNKQFKRGQLCNLGYKYSKGDIVVFQDVDIRYIEFVDFYKLMSRIGHPFLPWNYRVEISEDQDGKIKLLGEKHYTLQGYGGCSVFTRSQFERSYGFSNLCIGWGAEDTILNIRVSGFKRIPGNLYHIKHDSYRDEFNPETDPFTIHNRQMLKSHSKRRPCDDSFYHTEADSNISSDKNVQHIKFSNIRVSANCIYKDMVDKIYSENI